MIRAIARIGSAHGFPEETAHDGLIGCVDPFERPFRQHHQRIDVHEREVEDVVELVVPLQREGGHERRGDGIDQTCLQPSQDIGDGKRHRGDAERGHGFHRGNIANRRP